MPHFPQFRLPLSIAIVAAVTLQAASFSMPRMARAEDTPQRALLVSQLSWAANGLAMAGELLDVLHRSGQQVTIDANSPEKPSFLCFPVEQAPLPVTPPADPTPEPEPEPEPTPVPAPNPLTYSLTEAVSNPVSGNEWIELAVSPSDATVTDRALELWDAAGRIAQIASEAAVTNGYLVVTLPSAKLNNGGDELSLRTPDGITLDATTIPSLEKGDAWARDSVNAWRVTTMLTPGATNAFPAAAPTAPVDETPEDVAEDPVEEPTLEDPSSEPVPEPEPVPTMGPQLPVFLSEAMSRPSDGQEWVELFVPTSAETVLGQELQLWDAAGRIATLGADTPVPASGYLLVTLTSAKLNNGGDELSLRTPDGVILDSTTIPAVDEGSAWVRTDDNLWVATTTPTPGSANIAPSVLGATEDAVSAASSGTGGSSPSSSANELDLDLTDMPNETIVNRRVRLVGTVGSVPNLLGATHAFILLGEDGRAAIVYLPKHLHVPPLGSTVRVMGTLSATVKQLELRMKTTDVWMTLATSTPPAPRLVDFLAPGAEDAWSLTNARGTVTKTATQSVTLDVNGVDLVMSVPSAVGYRVSRLDKGDLVHVTGLLDPRKSTATILPRTPEDIQLVEHAMDSVVSPTDTHKPGFPDWIPFGAAVGAVISTGVAKRAYAFFKKKKLERLVVPHLAH